MADVEVIDEHTDLIHSPDDGGWYFHRYPVHGGDRIDEKTSRIYATRSEAHEAKQSGKIEWEE